MDQDPSEQLPGQMNVGGMNVFQREPVNQQGQGEGSLSVPISVGGWMDLNTNVVPVGPPTGASPVGGGTKTKPGRPAISVGDQDEWVRVCVYNIFERDIFFPRPSNTFQR